MAKNLERIGDHATNIAENIWFLVHGDEHLPPREKRDATQLVTPAFPKGGQSRKARLAGIRRSLTVASTRRNPTPTLPAFAGREPAFAGEGAASAAD